MLKGLDARGAKGKDETSTADGTDTRPQIAITMLVSSEERAL